MKIHCDKCNKELGTYLYGKGGVEEVAVIIPSRNLISMPDVVCFECWGTNNPKVFKKGDI